MPGGIKIGWTTEPEPRGLAQAFTIGADFVRGHKSGVVLGDNIFYGSGRGARLRSQADITGVAVFGYLVADPTPFGVVEVDDTGHAFSSRPRAWRSPVAAITCADCSIALDQ